MFVAISQQVANKLVNVIKLQQVCLCNLLFTDLLKLVETTCSKPVDNKF